MNRLIISGNIGQIETKVTDAGITMAKFSVAVSRSTKNPQGEYETDWFNCVAWRQTAEFLEKYCQKGTKIAVEGKVQFRKFEGDDGTKRTFTDIVVDHVEKLIWEKNGTVDAYDPNSGAQGTSGGNTGNAGTPAFDPFADE